MSNANSLLWLRALEFAAEKHRNQRCKDVDASPYINRPIAVASVLGIEAGVTDETTLLAALLHDTVEDTDTTLQELEQRFGREVAALVDEMSDDKSLPKEMRKELQVEHAPRASPNAKRLKIADKICDIRDVAENPPTSWSLDRRRQYVDWAERVVAGSRGTDALLETLFDRVMQDARIRLGVDA